MVPALTPASAAARPAAPRLRLRRQRRGDESEQQDQLLEAEDGGRDFEASRRILKPLEPLRDQRDGHQRARRTPAADRSATAQRSSHPRAAAWLNGVHPKHTEGADVRAGRTRRSGGRARRSARTRCCRRSSSRIELEVWSAVRERLQLLYVNTLAWMTPTTPLPIENNPRVVFERLFGEAAARSSAPRSHARTAAFSTP